MKVAVLGAGHGGQAMAADLTLGGHEVRLAAVPEHGTNIRLLQTFGGVVSEGVTSCGRPPGFAKISMITTDVAAALRGAQVVMIVVPAFGQEVYMDLLLEHGEKGQLVVFNPGKYASLLFAQKLRAAGRWDDFLVGETSCLIYAAKTKGLGHVNIKAVKSEQPFAALPSIRTAEALWTLTDLYPQFTPAWHVLQTSIDDPGSIVHPVSTLLNASRIEQMGPYRTGHYDITPGVARVIEGVDRERLEIARVMLYETCSLRDGLELMYKIKAASLYEGLYEIRAHDVQMAPDGLGHRYVSEDVPYGLVPLLGLGRALGIPTPHLEAFVTIASTACGKEFLNTGRTVEQLGIANMSRQQLIDHIVGKRVITV